MTKSTQIQTTQNVGTPSSLPQSIERREILIGGALTLLVVFALVAIYRKGIEKGNSRALTNSQVLLKEITEHNERSISEINSNSERLFREVANSNFELTRAIRNSQMIPEGYELIPLNEGVSFHRVGNNEGSNSYILRIERILEHRYVAQKVLGRDLEQNEIVHHIYGPATDDNRPENLCVLDIDKHQSFHSELQWRKEKNNDKYPSIDLQRRLLVHQYGGILVSEAAAKNRVRGPVAPPIPPLGRLTESLNSNL